MLLTRLLLCGSIWGFAVSAYAQQNGAQQAPPISRKDKAPIGQADEPPKPEPVPSTNILIRGRIIAPTTRAFPEVQVELETDGGQPVDFAYTNSTGEFSFSQTAGFSGSHDFYVVFKMDGYKPVRERVDGTFNFSTGYSGNATVFLDPENARPAENTGDNLVDVQRLSANIPDKALDEYQKALKDSSKGNTKSAAERLQRALKLAPDFYDAQSALGAQYMKMQKLQEAETALMRAQTLSPKAAEPAINLGRLYYMRGEEQTEAGHRDAAAAAFKKSLEFLQESVRRNPLSAPAQSYLGAVLYKIGFYAQAESTLSRALELDEQENDARLMLINVYVRQTRYEKALASIKSFLLKNPKAPQRASLEGMQAQLEKALRK